MIIFTPGEWGGTPQKKSAETPRSSEGITDPFPNVSVRGMIRKKSFFEMIGLR